MFDRQPATITFHFRPSHTVRTTLLLELVLHTESLTQSETIRTAVENLQTAMKDYKSLMTESTQQRIDTAIKFGSVIAEACPFLPLISMSYVLQMDPFAKLGFGLAKVTFDVSALLEYPLVVCHLHTLRLVVKGATEIRRKCL
jgi:hypothetical protein